MQTGIVFSQQEIIDFLRMSVAQTIGRVPEELIVTLRKDKNGEIEATVFHADGKTHLAAPK